MTTLSDSHGVPDRQGLEISLPSALELCRLGLGTMIDIRQAFEIDLKGAVPLPALDTEAALRSGIVLGAAGGVERILEGLRPDASCPVFLTGLDAALLSPHLRVPHRVHLGLGLLGVAAALRRSPPSPGQGLIGGMS